MFARIAIRVSVADHVISAAADVNTMLCHVKRSAPDARVKRNPHVRPLTTRDANAACWVLGERNRCYLSKQHRRVLCIVCILLLSADSQ